MKKSTQDIDLHARGTACLNELTKSDEKVNGLKDIIEELFGNDPNALMAMPIFSIRTHFSSEKVGYVRVRAEWKNALRFIKDGNDVQALANIDVEAGRIAL